MLSPCFMMAYRSDPSKYSCPRGPALLLTRFPLCISLVSFTIVVYEGLSHIGIVVTAVIRDCNRFTSTVLPRSSRRRARLWAVPARSNSRHSFTATPHCRLGIEHRPELQFSHRNFATSCLNDTHCTHGSYVSSIADTPGKLVVWIAFYWTNSRGALS